MENWFKNIFKKTPTEDYIFPPRDKKRKTSVTELPKPTEVPPNTEVDFLKQKLAELEEKLAKTEVKQKKPKKEKVEPRIDVSKFDFDPRNPHIGSLELDWNDEFIDLLKKNGYNGATDEEIVDIWLNDICRSIIMNQFPGEPLPRRKDAGSGKSEYY